jgi:hypothetical protein
LNNTSKINFAGRQKQQPSALCIQTAAAFSAQRQLLKLSLWWASHHITMCMHASAMASAAIVQPRK